MNQVRDNIAVVDIKMPFKSMVVFLVKLSLASIPALIILSVIGAAIGWVLGHFFAGPGAPVT